MVSICCGCDKVAAWAAVIIGAIAGPFMMICSSAVNRLGIDDPLDAFAVHGGGGIIGLVLTPFFWESHGLFYGNYPNDDGSTGGKMLGNYCFRLLLACKSSFRVTYFCYHLMLN